MARDITFRANAAAHRDIALDGHLSVHMVLDGLSNACMSSQFRSASAC